MDRVSIPQQSDPGPNSHGRDLAPAVRGNESERSAAELCELSDGMSVAAAGGGDGAHSSQLEADMSTRGRQAGSPLRACSDPTAHEWEQRCRRLEEQLEMARNELRELQRQAPGCRDDEQEQKEQSRRWQTLGEAKFTLTNENMADCGDGAPSCLSRQLTSSAVPSPTVGAMSESGSQLTLLSIQSAVNNDTAQEVYERISQMTHGHVVPYELVATMVQHTGVPNLLSLLELLSKEDKKDEKRHPKRTQFELCTADELPEYHAPYDYIKTGYRVHFSFWLCVKSMFRWHNETVNIWTELLPALAFFIFLTVQMATNLAFVDAPAGDRFLLAQGFYASLVFRSLCSGFAHAFHVQSREAYVRWWAIDFISICLNLLTMGLALGHSAFYCLPQLRTFFFIASITLFIMTLLSVLFVASNAVRTGFFILFTVFLSALPYIYALGLKEQGAVDEDFSGSYLAYWGAGSGTLAFAVALKAIQLPERLAPGKFDILFSSHQWWHLLIHTSNFLLYMALETYMRWRLTVPCA